MPELPEVETIRRDLEEAVIGRRVTAVYVHVLEAVKVPDPGSFAARLMGRTIDAAQRIGKYLLLRLDDGRTWVIHLSLEGQLLLVPQEAPIKEGTLLAVTLDDGRQLRMRDAVSFSKTLLLHEDDLWSELKLNLMGPEPVHPAFSEALLRERLRGRRGRIKPLLLNQRIIAGVGNIYVDEALWQARLHPERKVNTLTDPEWTALFEALRDVMREGVAERGTTAPGGLYRDLWGRKGKHQAHLKVFRRTGKPCPRDGTPLETSQVGGRPTFFCPTCQRLPSLG